MNTFYALLLIVAAGVVNGSFALPTKYITKWKFENIWLQYAIWSFVIFPWLLMLIVEPRILTIYAATPPTLLLIMCLGGFVFGIGQVCFALALNIIGLGLGFVINLGLGISLGFLLPLITQHLSQITTPFGIITLCGTAIAVCGLIVANHAGVLRDRARLRLTTNNNQTMHKNNQHIIGVILATLAGLSSASQNLVFSLTYNMQQIAINHGASQFATANILWPGFLICGFIPYAFYTLYLHQKKQIVLPTTKNPIQQSIISLLLSWDFFGIVH